MADKRDGPGIQPLHFFGDRDRPDRSEKVLDLPISDRQQQLGLALPGREAIRG